MTRKFFTGAAIAALVGLAACEKNLEVTNPNSGDTKRVLGTPNDAEALLGTYFKRFMSGVYGNGTDLEGMANVMSLENYSSLANNCQNQRAPFSGAANDNSPGNACRGEQFRLYSYMAEVDRVASSFLAQVEGGLTLGSVARDNRDKAYAEFLRGLARGYVSLMHDSAAVVSTATGPQEAGDLLGYKAVNDSAMAAFQRALDLTALSSNTAEGFPLPSDWIPSPTGMNKEEFSKLIRSYRARLRADVARTPAERAAVSWPAVIADVQNGITADHLITTSTTSGPSPSWRNTYLTFGLWHQMTPFIIGMADTSGSYAAWIAQPVSQRGSGNNGFFMVTPDQRFPQGLTRAAQQADFTLSSCQTPSTECKRYYVNRPSGADQYAGLGFGWSNYDNVRFYSWKIAGDGTARNGATAFITKAEMDMLEAEGQYRAGNFAAAGALINKTRVKNGLPPITAFNATSPVPGGSACVPKVPVGPNFTTIACGNLFEALKYEKRIEEAYTHYAAWYLDERGWGDLPEGTPLFWAVPYQDLQARGYTTSQIYGAGPGAGNAPNSTAGKSTYGW